MKGMKQKNAQVRISNHLFVHLKSFTNFLDTRKNCCNQTALRSAGSITLGAQVREAAQGVA